MEADSIQSAVVHVTDALHDPSIEGTTARAKRTAREGDEQVSLVHRRQQSRVTDKTKIG